MIMKKQFLLVFVLIMSVLGLKAQSSCTPPSGLTAIKHIPNWQNINLNWNAPVDTSAIDVMWCTRSFSAAIGSSEGPIDFYGIVRFDAEDLADHDGLALSSVSFYPYESPSLCTYSIYVWQGGSITNDTVYDPGTLMTTYEIPASDIVVGTINTFALSDHVIIDNTQEIWIGIRVTTTTADEAYPIGATSNGGVANKGELLMESGEFLCFTNDIPDLAEYNWLIFGTLTDQDNLLAGYNIYCNNNLLTPTPTIATSYLDSVENGSYTYQITAAYENGCESDPISIDVTMADNPCIDCMDSIIVGTETSGSYSIPFSTYYGYSYSQQIFTADEIGNFDGGIPCISFDYMYSSDQTKNLKVYMGNTNKSTFANASDWISLNQMYEVFDGTINFTANTSAAHNWVNIPLDIPFEWDGSSNIVVTILSNQGPYYYSTSNAFRVHSASSKALYSTSSSTPVNPNSPASGTVSSTRSNIRFMVGEPISCPMPSHFAVSNVTHESAELNWWSRGVENGYEIVVVPEGSSMSNETPIAIYDTNYVIYGLNENTNYTVYMHSLCSGDNSSWLHVTFKTACYPIMELPYTEDFNSYSSSDYAYPDCWNKLSSNVYPYITLNTSSNSNGLYLYSTTNTPCYAIIQALDESFDVSTLQLKFKAAKTSSAYGHLDIGVMTDPSDANTFTTIKTIDGSYYAQNSVFYDFTVYFNNYVGEGKYIAFRSPGDYTSYTYIDDVEIDFIMGCGSPSNLTISNTTGTSSLLSWLPSDFTDGSEVYTIEYSEQGMESWNMLTTTDNHIILSGLEPEMSYDILLYVTCNNGMSDTITAILNTGCLLQNEIAIGSSSSTNTYLPSYSFYNYGYTQQLFLASEIGDSTTLTSLALNMATLSHQRSYEFYLMHTNATSLASSWIPVTNAQLVYSGNQALVSGWNIFDFTMPFAYNGTDNLLLIVIDKTGSYVSGNAWYGESQTTSLSRYVYQDSSPYSIASTPSGSGTALQFRNAIKFKTCNDSLPTCVAPSVFVNNITSNSAEIAWAPGYQESDWELEYRLTEDTVWESIGTLSTTEFMLDNLMPSTSYDVRLRSDCYGEYSGYATVSFTTPCEYITDLPFTENFDSFSTTGTSVFPTCWNRISTYNDGYPYVSSSYASSVTNSLYFYNSSSNYYTLAALPRFDDGIDMSNLMIEFNTYFTSTSYFIEVGVMSDPTNANTFTPIRTIHPSIAYTWEPQEIFTNTYSGNGHNIAFRIPVGIFNTAYVDDINIEYIPTCRHINNMSVSNIDTYGASISWESAGDESQWEIIVLPSAQAANADLDACMSDFSYTPSYDLSGLQPSTSYTVFVRAYCDVYDQSSWRSISFQTAQIPAQLPFDDDFEGEANWGFANGNLTNRWCIGSAINNGGTNAMYVSNDNGVSNSYNTSSAAYVWAYRDIEFPACTNGYQLSFDWKATGESGYDYMRVYVGNTDAPVAGTSLNAPSGAYMVQPNINTSYPQAFNMQTTWSTYSCVLPGYTSSCVKRVFFLWQNDGTGGSNPPAAIDNVHISIVTCPAPTNVTLTNTTLTSAELNWQPGGDETEWSIIYGTTGFSPSTGGTTVTATTHPYTLTGLSDANTYEAYLVANCGGDDQSMLVGPISINPGAIMMPTYGTQSVTACGGHIYDDGGPNGSYSSSCNGTLVINPDDPDLVVKLTGTYNTESSYDQLVIYNGYTAVGSPLGTYSGNGSINVTSTTGSLTLVFTSDASVNNSGFALAVACVEKPCDVPTNVQVTANDNIITLTWNGGTATAWNVQYRTANGEWSADIPVTTTQYTFTDLTGTAYEVRVQAACGTTNSDWASTSFNIGINNYMIENGVTLMPNPATNYVDVLINNDEVSIKELQVYDVYGKLLKTLKADSNPTRIDINGLASGMYIVRIVGNTGIANKSFIKE